MLNKLHIEHYKQLVPDMSSAKPNGYKTLPKGDTAYINPEEDVKFTGIIEFVPGTGVRGNHYHKNKLEILYIISGEIKAYYWEADNPDEITEVIHTKGDKITIPPCIGHGFEAIQHTIVLEMTTTAFDMADTFYKQT
ncbi:MAG: cupin domain-containing protein [Legionellaceae bacterium]|nr:cupin domain-containing protein [Legionellaceae bacterium]